MATLSRMSGPAATPIGADEAPRGKAFYGSGPWLIAYGHGPESEALAKKIAEQCDARGVDYDLATADEVDPSPLRYYVGLSIVLPVAAAGPQVRSHDHLADLIRAYRARRPAGRSALINGSRWFEVGVVQVFDQVAPGATPVVRPAIEPLVNLVCRYHRVIPGEPPMPFTCYENLGRPDQPEPDDHGDTHFPGTIATLRATLAGWGVAWEQREIIRVRKFIEDMREVWESSAFSDLHRPVPGDARNRLDFLLDEPTFVPPEDICSHKKWMEGGQRVVSRVLADLRTVFPAVHRPPGRDGKKGKQKDFQDFYLALCGAVELLTIPRSGV
jgi:hypothetical protein